MLSGNLISLILVSKLSINFSVSDSGTSGFGLETITLGLFNIVPSSIG